MATPSLQAERRPRGPNARYMRDIPPGAFDNTHVRIVLAVRAGNHTLASIAKAVQLPKMTIYRYVMDLRREGILGPPVGTEQHGAIHCLYGMGSA